MRYWWVNQNQTYASEVPGGFMWSPKSKKNGGRNQFYDNMRSVMPGDVIFSFCDTRIKAIGMATGPAASATKPDFGASGASWSDDGWFVPVEFTELHNLIHPRSHIEQIRPHLPAKYAPLQTTSGHGLQSVYLAEVPETMAHLLAELIGEEYQQVVSAHQSQVLDEGNDDLGDQEERAIAESKDIGETERLQLTKARRGQGLFKSNVRLNEHACRVTGTADVAHLRASHIKPWKVSSNSEKLDGCNGLLLSPHIDHLFDRGYISFGDDGQLLVSAQLSDAVLSTWQISVPRNVGVFNERQCTYLQYHRQHVLKL